MTVSLAKAQLILSAAMAAGMRESGVQSLKTLTTPTSFPTVAVRCVGLAFSSVIGYLDENEGSPRSLVSEEYLMTMIMLANSRFSANASRIARFQAALALHQRPQKIWEDKSTRAARKRLEGLRKQGGFQHRRRGAGPDHDEHKEADISNVQELL
jgi:tRNA wybutosine-synthesizing protein 3